MADWLFRAAAGVAVGAIICNFSSLLIPRAQHLTLAYIRQARLQTIGKDKRIFDFAEDLSSLKPEMDARNVPLYAVVHESMGAVDFQKFFKGDIFLDLERKFYGPVERWLNIPSLFHYKSLTAFAQTTIRGTPGNLKGEGRLLGGVYVIGPEEQGVVFEHFESVAGDDPKLDDIRQALKKIKQNEN